MNETIENKILRRIRKCGRGSVFFSSDFHAYGSRVSVNKTLERMTAAGTIIRVARGIYCYPKLDKVYGLGAIPPSDEEIAMALWESIRHHREIYTSVNGMDYTPDVRNRQVLVPREDIMDAWKTDYEQMMGNMIYGEKPTWDELMVAMNELQERVRNSVR